jgi:hypothetical protein
MEGLPEEFLGLAMLGVELLLDESEFVAECELTEEFVFDLVVTLIAEILLIADVGVEGVRLLGEFLQVFFKLSDTLFSGKVVVSEELIFAVDSPMGLFNFPLFFVFFLGFVILNQQLTLQGALLTDLCLVQRQHHDLAEGDAFNHQRHLLPHSTHNLVVVLVGLVGFVEGIEERAEELASGYLEGVLHHDAGVHQQPQFVGGGAVLEFLG